jgi:hypothetical protein
VVPNKEWSVVDVAGKVTYNEILYALASFLGLPTPTQQGISTAYKWLFSSLISEEDPAKALTVEQGDANSAWRAADVFLSGLSFVFNRKEVSMSGSGLGSPIETGITMTATPTSMAARPVLPTQGKFYIADAQADLATATAMTRGFSAEYGLSDKITQAWPVGEDPVKSEKEGKLGGKLKLAADTVGMGLIATMRAGSTKWFRFKYEGPVIADTYKWTYQIDFPAQILGVSKPSDEDGIFVFEYELQGIYDATWGKAFEITLINDVQTL